MEHKELEAMVENMTLREKVGQMMQLTGSFFSEDGVITGPMSEIKFEPEVLKNTASVLNIPGGTALKQFQEAYLKENPHGIPLVFMADVIHGYRTVFPIPLAQGCSFDPELVKKAAGIAAKESAAAGFHVTFSPMADLVRDPRWGRCMESTGEDVFLNGQMARACVEGYQGDSLKQEGTIGACLKHFAGYGAAEGGRDYNTVDMSELSLREQYLPAYREAVEAGTALVMTSFNTINGIPATANKWLMEDVLRKEWGFDGVLISDYGAVIELMKHGVAATKEEAGQLAMEAGLDLDMVSPVYGTTLEKLVKEGKVPEKWIDRAVLRILELKDKLGLFDNPLRFPELMEKEDEIQLCKEHREVAEKLAEESMVLLKNEGILPLDPKNMQKKTIALLGPYADSRELLSTWTLFGKEEDTVTLKEGMEAVTNASEQTEVRYLVEEGCHILDPEEELVGFHQQIVKNDWSETEIEAHLQNAVEYAAQADVVVLALGEHTQHSGESASRASLRLSKGQIRLFEEVSAVNPNVIVVLFSGRPLVFPEINVGAKAILQAWRPGTEGGNAAANLLFGNANPSGRLSMTFPKHEGQIPAHYNRLNTGRPALGRSDRFLSTYCDVGEFPEYPFGYGLSYTDFAYSPVKTDKKVYEIEEDIKVSVEVTNVGDRGGTEVVQCYVQDMVGTTARPVRELKGFQRVYLEPGEKKQVEFIIKEPQTRMITRTGEWKTEPGMFRIYVGKDSSAADNFEEVEKFSIK